MEREQDTSNGVGAEYKHYEHGIPWENHVVLLPRLSFTSDTTSEINRDKHGHVVVDHMRAQGSVFNLPGNLNET